MLAEWQILIFIYVRLFFIDNVPEELFFKKRNSVFPMLLIVEKKRNLDARGQNIKNLKKIP